MNLKQISQKIVHIMMEVIDNRNINIMDRDGFIIASGEPNRINTYHKGADDVIKSGTEIEIYPEQVNSYPGAKEGVNLPINIEGKVIGVVGVYGHPNEVRTVARLVKNSVELALEQYLISKEIILVKDLKQQLIRKLVYESISENEEEILCLFKVAEIDIDKERCAVVIKLQDGRSEQSYKMLKMIDCIERCLIRANLIGEHDFYGMLNSYFVIFKSVEEQRKSIFIDKIHIAMEEFKEDLFSIGIGSSYKKIAKYRQSFEEAVELLKMGSIYPMNIEMFDIQAQYLLHKIEEEAYEHFIGNIYDSIMDQYNEIPSWLYETLKVLFKHNLNLVEAANELYIHKNTLVYRTKKIEQITGLSIHNNFYHGILLRCLLIYIDKKHLL